MIIYCLKKEKVCFRIVNSVQLTGIQLIEGAAVHCKYTREIAIMVSDWPVKDRKEYINVILFTSKFVYSTK